MLNKRLLSRLGGWLTVGAGLGVALGLSPLQAASPGDSDGDGHRAIGSGGDDCDDDDANRYPGAVEVCDAGHRDEDCNPTTFGFRDADGDGLVSAQCCNVSSNSVHCGDDPDDHNAAIRPGSIVCSGVDPYVAQVDGTFHREACTTGTTCIPQPNGTGICAAEPPGYSVPPTRNFWQRPSPSSPSQPVPKKPINKKKAVKPGPSLPGGSPKKKGKW